MSYVALQQPSPEFPLLGDMALLLLLLCLYAGLGHIVNSYCDRKIDTVACKVNTLAQISEKNGLKLVVIIIITSVVTVFLVYIKQPIVLFLFYLAIVIAAFYSLPPVRLKERGIFGLVAAAVTQRTLPVVIVFHALEAWDWTVLVLCVLSTLIGMRYIIVHQIKDESADLLARVQTVATTRGTIFLQKFLNQTVFPLELVTLVIAILLMTIDLPSVGVVAVLYLFWTALQLVVLDRKKETRFSIESYTILADFYCFYWPLLLSALLIERNKVFWIVFIFTLVWLFKRLRREIVQVWQVISVLRKSFYYK
jgi:4-hydroxybenzoate polyprenyltransferase